jgi:hypothetical protein
MRWHHLSEGVNAVDRELQRREVDANYDYFARSLSTFLPDHIGQYALLKSREIVDFFDTPSQAYRHALDRFGQSEFSIQEVTEEPIDLGFFSHVAS